MNNLLIDAGTLFSVILYILGSILLVILIILTIKAIKTLKKIDTLVDDIQLKSNKVDGVFDIVDTTTDFVNSISDKIIGGVVGVITKIFEKKGEDKNE